MTTLYISGPMTGYPDHNFAEFFRVHRALAERGFLILNPAEKGIVYGWTWEDYLKHDLHEVLRADGVAVLDGWECSRGAQLEVSTAHALAIPVRPWHNWRSPNEQ